MAALIPLFRNAVQSRSSESDRELLARFAAGRDEDAFAELVRRHGPVVYRVCRRVVGLTAGDDAFQATFLVLATRLDAARAATSIGGWLVGVAGRVARQMRRAAGRRTRYETAAALERRECLPDPNLDMTDQFRVLDEELARLPEGLRDPVVLCLLQGRTQEQAATELGRDARTLRRRLDRAKQVLRARLERRGVIPAVAAALVTGAGSVTAAVPINLSLRTVATVFDFLTGGRAISQSVPVVLANGVAKTMIARKAMRLMAVVALGLVGLGVVAAGDEPRPARLNREDLRNETRIAQSNPKAAAGERPLLIQAVCVHVPLDFSKNSGLLDGKTDDVGGWAILLTPRETRMLQSLLRAGREKQEIDILSRPQILVIENQTGFVQVGQDVPFAATTAEKKDDKEASSQRIDYRFCGVSLKVIPRINPDGRILLRVDSELSTVTEPINLGNGIKAPAFNSQSLKTTILTSDGETIVLSGGCHRTEKAGHEVLWLLTPHIVRGEGAAVPPSPIAPVTGSVNDSVLLPLRTPPGFLPVKLPQPAQPKKEPVPPVIPVPRP
jgi:RNA polymerase sigma factor (sigma-70 family)